MQELLLYVPTYYGGLPDDQPGEQPDFGDPRVPVLIRRSDGVRIVLASHDYFDNDAPDIQIERRPNGWAIFLHPLGGGDPSGHIYFVDDGRSYVVPEADLGTTPPITQVDSDTATAQVDQIKSPS